MYDIINPIKVEQIYMNPHENNELNMYFPYKSNEKYERVHKYHSLIKNTGFDFISQSINYVNILDLGIGKGNNILKYCHIKANKVIGVDNDVDAL
jgi:predicted RNA methylase